MWGDERETELSYVVGKSREQRLVVEILLLPFRRHLEVEALPSLGSGSLGGDDGVGG